MIRSNLIQGFTQSHQSSTKMQSLASHSMPLLRRTHLDMGTNLTKSLESRLEQLTIEFPIETQGPRVKSK